MGDYNDFAKRVPTFEWGNGPRDWLFFDDFNALSMSTTSGAATWTHLTTDAGNTALLDVAQGRGVLKLAYSTPTDEDVIHLQANSGLITGTDLQANTPIRFGIRFKTADVSHNDMHFGLSIPDTSMAASAPADWVGFRCLASEGAGELNLVVSKDGVVQQVDPILIMADSTWVRAFFEFWPTSGNPDSGTLLYRVHTNGMDTKWQSLAVANTWPDDVFISPLIQVQIEGTDEDVIYVDHIYGHAILADYVDGTG